MSSRLPEIICISCNFSFCGRQTALPKNVKVVRVQCVGRLDPVSVLEIFEKGIDGVMLAGCKPPDCHFREGNAQTEFAVGILKRLLKHCGLGPERLRLLWVSPLECQDLTKYLKEFSQEISKLDASPLKKATAESQYPINIIAARNVASQFRTRVLLGREKELIESANSYGEKILRTDYDAMLDEIIEDEFVRYKIHFLTKNVSMSVKDLAQATGLTPPEVLDHVVDMRRRNMLVVDRIDNATPLYKALEVLQ